MISLVLLPHLVQNKIVILPQQRKQFHIQEQPLLLLPNQKDQTTAVRFSLSYHIVYQILKRVYVHLDSAEMGIIASVAGNVHQALKGMMTMKVVLVGLRISIVRLYYALLELIHLIVYIIVLKVPIQISSKYVSIILSQKR